MVIPESFFIGISIFIVAIYLLMIYLGYKRGLLYELVSLLYTALALFIAWFAAPVLASLFQLFDISKVSDKYAFLNKVLNLNSLLNTAAYFLIIFLIMRLLYLFISLLVKGFNK
ncbi:MAG: CvpA family protein, partial [Erysipelotrichaceae bacterium]|nr:CvpA family protein [Erysipelotrichaceae bacterium]